MTILDAVYSNGRTHGFCLLGVVGVVGGPACGVIVGLYFNCGGSRGCDFKSTAGGDTSQLQHAF